MLVRQLLGNGHTVELFARPWRDYTKHLSDNLSAQWMRSLAEANVDLLLQDELNHPSLAWINPRLRTKMHGPLVSIVHHLRSSEQHSALALRLYRWVERTYLDTLDAYLANSQTTHTSVQSIATRSLPALVAYPAADHGMASLRSFGEREIETRTGAPGPIRILFVGNVIPRKALHTVVAALGTVEKTAWRLSVVGRLDVDPRYVRRTRQLAARLDIEQQIEFLGRVTDVQLLEQYQSHHVLAVPSYEGFGIVYLEAMRSGLPVIAATAGAAHEIVTPGVDGYLVDLGDTSGLANAIHTLATDRPRLTQMSIAAYDRYLRHPTWETSMQSAVDWLEKLKP
jgi:glycosyltransferase involved in cell wall biosynthesis